MTYSFISRWERNNEALRITRIRRHVKYLLLTLIGVVALSSTAFVACVSVYS